MLNPGTGGESGRPGLSFPSSRLPHRNCSPVQRRIKNGNDPRNSVYPSLSSLPLDSKLTSDRLEMPTPEHGKLGFDSTAFLVPLVFRGDIFTGINSPSERRDFRGPEEGLFSSYGCILQKLDAPTLRQPPGPEASRIACWTTRSLDVILRGKILTARPDMD